MPESDFWKKYNHCPYCRWYTMQGRCGDCKWYLIPKDGMIDMFQPTEECERLLAEYKNDDLND